MIDFKQISHTYIYGQETDLRMGLYRIQLLVYANFSPVDIHRSLFIFGSKNHRNIKIYYENEFGYWLLQNKISFTSFKWPDSNDVNSLSNENISRLLKGLRILECGKREVAF